MGIVHNFHTPYAVEIRRLIVDKLPTLYVTLCNEHCIK